MGFRTVVMLSNDRASEWENDQELGKRIARAMNYANSRNRSDLAHLGSYGRVVECAHGDCQTLAVLDGYESFETMAVKSWIRDESKDAVALKLLKEAAENLGYRLVKRASRQKESQ